MGGKVRMMLVVSREDRDAPRALSLCVPITTSCRGSRYEVELPPRPFFRSQSFANVQGLQAIQHQELQGKIGIIFGEPLDRVREALRFAFDL